MSWQADRAKSRLETLRRLVSDAPNTSLRVALLVAHPDDETIGASALLARFPSAHVIFLTDGAPRDTKLWPPDIRGSREDYADIRREEAEKALAHAGIAREQISWLGGVDQDVVLEIRSLAAKLKEHLHDYRPQVLITHPYEGGHPDHDSAALIARLAIAGLATAAPDVCEMTSYHARDGQCVTGEFLNSNPSTEVLFDLTEADRASKRRMMNEYKSQRLVLDNFSIAGEKLRIAPEYDFSQPPYEGKLWYECMGWAMTGARWRELAAAASSRAQECSCG